MYRAELKIVRIISFCLLAAVAVISWTGCGLREEPEQPTPTLTSSTTYTVTPTRPIPSLTPSATSTPAPPTATPTPSISPAERLPRAQALQRYGDYEHAVAEYAAILSSSPSPDLAAEALFQLGETYFLQGDYRMVIDVFNHFLEDYPEANQLPRVLFRLATAHRQLGDWKQALAYYERYAAGEDQISGDVQARIGEAYVHLGEDDLAAAAYERALAADIPAAWQRQIREELGLIYRRLQKYDEAVAQYERILESDLPNAHRARLLYEIGATLFAAGRAEEAEERYKQVIEKHPQEYAAYQALVALLGMDVQDIDPLQRGVVDYYAGQYRVCIEVLEEYIEEDPQAEAAKASFYIGLAYQRLENWDAALKSFEQISEDYPKSEWVPEAWFQKASVLHSSGQEERAIAAYAWLASRYPDHRLADDALWRQAQLLETLGRPEEASLVYRSLAGLTESEYAEQARFRRGLVHYRVGAYQEAAEAWEDERSGALSQDTRAKLLFWTGKALEALGEREEAETRWEKAVRAAPDTYYGLRAEAMRNSLRPEVMTTTLQEKLYDLQLYPTAYQGKEEAKLWLKALGESLGETPDLEIVQQEIQEEAAFRNGQRLLALGAREEAVAEFRRLRDQVRDRPAALYVLALQCDQWGLYSLASACIERIIALAKVSSAREVPLFLLQLAYPVHYAELVVPEAQTYNLDPRLYFALMRQESRFDTYATSWAGARGLSQIMPATGRWIAETLGEDRFRKEDLYKPYVNIRYGCWYLAQALAMFDGHILAALAGYNGGPGNVKTWAGGLPIQDIDLFVENISFAETKTYVMEVWKQYEMYRWLYPVE